MSSSTPVIESVKKHLKEFPQPVNLDVGVAFEYDEVQDWLFELRDIIKGHERLQ
ncbi:hypothetical protein ES703_96215 [subsurface metagenome]